MERAVIPAWQLGTPRLQSREAWLTVGRIAGTHILRNRRSGEAVTVSVIVLVALARRGWKVMARAVRELIAWDDARLADLESQPHRPRISHAADGVIVEGTVIKPRLAEAPSRQHNALWLGVGLVAATRALRNRRFDEQVIVAMFAAAALAHLSWKELVRAVMDLIAWDNARLGDLNRRRREREASAAQPTAS